MSECLNCGAILKRAGKYCDRKLCRVAKVQARYYKQTADVPERKCEVCGTVLYSRRADIRFCTEHRAEGKRIRRLEARVIRLCTGGCGRQLTARNSCGYCRACKQAKAIAENWGTCARPECENRLRLASNHTGYCQHHQHEYRKAKQAAEAEAAARAEREYEQEKKAEREAKAKKWQRMAAQLKAASREQDLAERARKLADSPEEERQILAALLWQEQFIADRRRRGVPRNGYQVDGWTPPQKVKQDA